jgi:hypothetical protein
MSTLIFFFLELLDSRVLFPFFYFYFWYSTENKENETTLGKDGVRTSISYEKMGARVVIKVRSSLATVKFC